MLCFPLFFSFSGQPRTCFFRHTQQCAILSAHTLVLRRGFSFKIVCRLPPYWPPALKGLKADCHCCFFDTLFMHEMLCEMERKRSEENTQLAKSSSMSNQRVRITNWFQRKNGHENSCRCCGENELCEEKLTWSVFTDQTSPLRAFFLFVYSTK